VHNSGNRQGDRGVAPSAHAAGAQQAVQRFDQRASQVHTVAVSDSGGARVDQEGRLVRREAGGASRRFEQSIAGTGKMQRRP